MGCQTLLLLPGGFITGNAMKPHTVHTFTNTQKTTHTSVSEARQTDMKIDVT